MKSFKTVFVEDANMFKEETITSQSALHNVQLIRNLPNILRTSNTKTSRNHKVLNIVDTSLISNVEDGNTSLDLNTSIDMEVSYNKIALPKSHHQRKQVHNPLNVQYDIPDSRNNKNKNILPIISQLNALHVSPSGKKNASTKRITYNNKRKKHSLNIKSKKITARKPSSKTRMSDKKPATIPDINMKKTVVIQNANNFLENDTPIQSICNPNFPNINVNDLHDIATKSVELSNIFYRNDIYNDEKKYDINLNHVISCKPTEFNTVQHRAIQKDFTSYGFPITENNLQQESIDRDYDSNFVYRPKIFYSCSCANCISHDKDIIFYEDPTSAISTSTSSDDTEEEFFTYDLYTNIYDFYINNYSHIFDDNLMDFEKTNLYCEEFGKNNIMKENVCIDTKSTTELIESSANMSSINMSTDQNKSQTLQSYHINRIQDRVESYPTELVTYPQEERMENVRDFDDMDSSNYLNPENFSMKKNEIISQGETLIQTAVSTDVFVSNSKCQSENEKGKLKIKK